MSEPRPSRAPVALTAAHGTDAVRWWLLREVPRVGDADFTPERLAARADADFAGGLGNLVHRTVTMAHRYRGGAVPGHAALQPEPAAEPAVAALADACRRAPGRIDAALEDLDFRRATGAAWRIVEEANRCVDATRPWEQARAERQGDEAAGRRLDSVLAALLVACRVLADELAPFVPDAAARIARQAAPDGGGVLPDPGPLFTRAAAHRPG